MLEKIENLKAEIENLSATSSEEVEALRIKYLSKKGEISALMNDFRSLPGEEKRALGAPLNQLKDFATEKIAALREALENKEVDAAEFDMTRSASPVKLGTRHPLSVSLVLVFL